ncbi:N-acyl-D-amino-acid deacylase [Anaerosolibacter carboniphilus]|uniref:N-acyl-D-amino-acid deacylase n=1 Tax=Anaerosolibacter carboniphilus TaxID=1417629 RepID=A0A841L0A2_9FIRM|nr:amidohydrolase family protein [Anaerosolibacter carboniphilus]MBB6218983.1 N-acyl-D-amino-acid deacylase [Anaerosolibacter carboniphilus]
MDKAILNGLVIDPYHRVQSKLNLGIENGKIVKISSEYMDAKEIIDAKGLIVCPGFIDIHIHEDPYHQEQDQFDICIFQCMVQMGVTTAIGGNCGTGPKAPGVYLDAIDRIGIPINLGLLVPHEQLRQAVMEEDKYKAATQENIRRMKELAEQQLAQGCMGISFGIRYIPGITRGELLCISEAAQKDRKIIAAHIRDDAKQVIAAVQELVDIGMSLGLPIQVSHIGSMAAYGQMEEVLSLIDFCHLNGMDIYADCYPYGAFSTGIGETTYDDGFLERYAACYEDIEIAEGIYKGKRCTAEIFEKLRKEAPEIITIGHVMNEEEIEQALRHPKVILASDGYMHSFQGHPRASGTFPRLIHHYVKEKKALSLYEAIEKMTVLPAKRMGISKGNLGIGSDADIVIFDFDELKDQATFENPHLPPRGIKYVLVQGEVAAKNGNMVCGHLGRSIRK